MDLLDGVKRGALKPHEAIAEIKVRADLQQDTTEFKAGKYFLLGLVMGFIMGLVCGIIL